jgi:hypothetical protein
MTLDDVAADSSKNKSSLRSRLSNIYEEKKKDYLRMLEYIVYNHELIKYSSFEHSIIPYKVKSYFMELYSGLFK